MALLPIAGEIVADAIAAAIVDATVEIGGEVIAEVAAVEATEVASEVASEVAVEFGSEFSSEIASEVAADAGYINSNVPTLVTDTPPYNIYMNAVEDVANLDDFVGMEEGPAMNAILGIDGPQPMVLEDVDASADITSTAQPNTGPSHGGAGAGIESDTGPEEVAGVSSGVSVSAGSRPPSSTASRLSSLSWSDFNSLIGEELSISAQKHSLKVQQVITLDVAKHAKTEVAHATGKVVQPVLKYRLQEDFKIKISFIMKHKAKNAAKHAKSKSEAKQKAMKAIRHYLISSEFKDLRKSVAKKCVNSVLAENRAEIRKVSKATVAKIVTDAVTNALK